MNVVGYQIKSGKVITNYNHAKECGIEKVVYIPIEEDYKKDAVNALIKARRNARKAVKQNA